MPYILCISEKKNAVPDLDEIKKPENIGLKEQVFAMMPLQKPPANVENIPVQYEDGVPYLEFSQQTIEKYFEKPFDDFKTKINKMSLSEFCHQLRLINMPWSDNYVVYVTEDDDYMKAEALDQFLKSIYKWAELQDSNKYYICGVFEYAAAFRPH